MRHDPCHGVESLEDRQLMTVAPAAPVPAAPMPVASVALSTTLSNGEMVPTMFGLAQDPFLTTVLYDHPTRMVSQIALDGAVGVNATWEAGQAPAWYIEEQRYGADFVQAGLVTHNTSLVQQGWNILNWGFAKEAANGSFPGTGDPFHSTSMFVEGAARALILEVESGDPSAPALLAKYLPMVDASAHWLMTPSMAAEGAGDDAPYTHRRWLLAAALGEVGQLTGETAETAAAANYAAQGLALQLPNGENPERGGGDTTYQMYGILLAARYATTLGDPVLEDQVEGMMVAGLQWEENAISAGGQVSTVGNTRIGIDLSRSGNIKTTDFKTIIQGFDDAAAITGDITYLYVAQDVVLGLGWSLTK